MESILSGRSAKLFVILAGIFVTTALVAEFIGVKIFSMEASLGLQPVNWQFFGVGNLSFNLTAGVLLWPVVFVMTDIINEYYGTKGVKFLSWMTAGLISFAFLITFIAIQLEPAGFWPQSHINPSLSPDQQKEVLTKVGDYNYAFRLVFGQGLWIIVGSLVAFLVGQLVDVVSFHRIKKITGEQHIWLRATGSTLISQLIDSFVVLFVAFYLGANWSLSQVFAIGLVNYIYKFFMAVLLTPVIYWMHAVIERYLGPEAARLRALAMADD
ncbi:MAG TPA: VUT family protein [Saprospiraceae bacterium]|nr:VUT family protein [Saprospiraceae bacterium]